MNTLPNVAEFPRQCSCAPVPERWNYELELEAARDRVYFNVICMAIHAKQSCYGSGGDARFRLGMAYRAALAELQITTTGVYYGKHL